MRTFPSPADIRAAAGEHLGYSDWLQIEQQRVDAFAEATGDHQWIHVDPARAAQGPFGGTIAHGFLMLSLLPMLCAQVFRVDGAGMAVNYGLNRVRFPAPVRTGSQARAGVRLLDVEDVAGGVQTRTEVIVELQGSPKPCCVAETVTRYYEKPA